MLRPGLTRVLITTDAAGGVWRYASDLAAALGERGADCLLAGYGPEPASRLSGVTEIVWTGEKLDWLVEDEAELDSGASALSALAREWRADLIHVNAPSQAAGLPPGIPLVAASHSCVPTWFDAVRREPPPASWSWHVPRNLAGLRRADAVLAPSRSHAAALARIYGPIRGLHIVANATSQAGGDHAAREGFVLAVGRWWDDAKGGDTLDAAAASISWPVRIAGATQGPGGQRSDFAHAQALGELPAGEVRDLMRRAAILAAPSRYEPFGLAVLEAAARGCALALSDIPTFRELWDGAAVFAPANDPAAWSDAINRLAHDPAGRRRLSAAAMLRARTFTPERQLAGVLGAYQAATAVSERVSCA